MKSLRSSLFIMLLLGSLPGVLSARTLTVAQDGSGEFADLQLAINTADPGDTVEVKPGHYAAGVFDILKSITLKGAGADKTTVVTAIEAFSIGAEEVTIEGFNILANGNGVSLIPAIGCGDCSATIKHNIISGGHEAIRGIGNARLIVQYNDFQANVGIRLINNPNTIDARFNWWGTTDPQKIRKKVVIGPTNRGMGNVNTSEPLSLNQRKSLFPDKRR